MQACGGELEGLKIEKGTLWMESWDVVVGEKEMFEFIAGFEGYMRSSGVRGQGVRLVAPGEGFEGRRIGEVGYMEDLIVIEC